jgi:hypothetical protein
VRLPRLRGGSHRTGLIGCGVVPSPSASPSAFHQPVGASRRRETPTRLVLAQIPIPERLPFLSLWELFLSSGTFLMNHMFRLVLCMIVSVSVGVLPPSQGVFSPIKNAGKTSPKHTSELSISVQICNCSGFCSARIRPLFGGGGRTVSPATAYWQPRATARRTWRYFFVVKPPNGENGQLPKIYVFIYRLCLHSSSAVPACAYLYPYTRSVHSQHGGRWCTVWR